MTVPNTIAAGASTALTEATPADAEVLANLLELYIHDLSAIFPHVTLGPNARFGYPALASYLSRSDGRSAFLVTYEGQLAGFALARRGSPAVADPEVLDIAEFFILRRHRGRGVGRAAAHALWERLPGSWTVRALQRNHEAVTFWRSAVASFTNGAFHEFERTDASGPWSVFELDTSRPFR